MGCNYGQGYYFSEPIEEQLALQWLRTQQPFQPPPSPTIEGRPPGEDTSSTMIMEAIPDPAPKPAASGAKVRPQDEDGSPTISIPIGSIDITAETEPE
jgi:hypothetical protein